MTSKKRMLFNIIFLILVLGLTLYGVFHGRDIHEILRILKTVNPVFLIPGVFCVLFFIWGESIIIYYMLRTLGIRVKKWSCFLFSSIGFFFSCITPSASGGQPAQIFYMNKEKIPVPVSTLILMIVTIIYKLVLVVIGVFLLLFGQDFIQTYLYDIRHIFYLGIALNVFCVTSMTILVFHNSLARNILVTGLSILEKLHLVRHKESRLNKLNSSMDQYNNTAEYLRTHALVMFNVFIITMLQRTALFLTTWFVYLAFGLEGASLPVVVTLQAVISVSVDMLPLPGGMGISEKLFLMIFIPIFGTKLLIPGMILSRGLGYYTELILSAVLTIAAHFTLGRKKAINVIFRSKHEKGEENNVRIL
ncbi:MAG: lysylphosphatidylglycerol synthase transmembrane domain-containing protein [Lachnospiraceae bacterium]|nr:lysylphosphatidylglycerol synthase transmembrane domain-containing protein [Lachnospiraceae bacterium]